MPKSKRAKVLHLSKVEKKGKEHTQRLFDSIREAADRFQHVFVFSVENMRNTYLKDVRSEFADSRIFFGKTKVMAKSLGQNVEAEYLPNLSKLSPHIAGDVGLLFTSRTPEDVIDHFSSYTEHDFARAGTPATYTFTVPAGTVYSRGGELPIEEDAPLPASMETQVRKWGLPTRLVKGKVTLDEDHTVVREGQTMDSSQAALLKCFGVAMAEFRVELKAYWSAAAQEVTVLDQQSDTD